MIIYREDQEFNVNELIPTINNGANKFDPDSALHGIAL